MKYHNITHDDMKNGEGIRVVLWVSGCEHHCPECQNQETWDKDSGIPFDGEAIKEILEEFSKEYVSGITFSGGDPLSPYNCEEVYHLIFTIKRKFPYKTIWLYTGYTYEELLMKNVFIENILWFTDVLVDGEYKKDLKNLDLKWRGSSNQRVIDVQKSLIEGKVVLWCD